MHKLLQTVKAELLADSTAMTLCNELLDGDPDLLTKLNGLGEGPDDLAAGCRSCPGVRRLFVVELFGRYRLVCA